LDLIFSLSLHNCFFPLFISSALHLVPSPDHSDPITTFLIGPVRILESWLTRGVEGSGGWSGECMLYLSPYISHLAFALAQPTYIRHTSFH
jgi:hypothetical protein